MSLDLKKSRRLEKLAVPLEDTTSFATTLLVIFLDQYGVGEIDKDEDCLFWDPATVLLELRDDFNVELPRENFDKLMAAITLVNSNRFYKNLPDFIAICNVLSGGLFDPSQLDLADAAECAWGITEAMLIEMLLFGEHDEDEPFVPQIRGYIGEVLNDEGILNPPDVLRIGQRDGGDRMAKVHSDYFDDPDTLKDIMEMEQTKTRGITDSLRSNLSLLLSQIESLELASGEMSGLASKLAKSLGRE